MKQVYIIAEAGVNHNGDIVLAEKMIEAAKDAGVNCIKFQTFVAENVATKSAQKAKYQKLTSEVKESQLGMLKKLELSKDAFAKLKKSCDNKKIEFLSTPFDFESIAFLESIGIKRWKIPSGEITNLPYLIRIGKTKLPVILSTGMAELKEVEIAIKILRECGTQDLSVLHCTTEYPAPYEDVNLRAMLTMRDKFNFPVGYSDHTMGVEISIAAVAMGASIIEKHFTLDRKMEGPDHEASLEPDELKKLVQSIRHVESAMGDGVKQPAESEKKNISIARKSIVAERKITKGELFTEENLTVKRPGNGVSPMKWFEILGKKAVKNFEEDELIEV